MPAAGDLVFGDVHGCFTTVESALAELRYDPARDRLFSLGDTIDYGPRSGDALEWMQSRFTCTVRGNHEDMMRDWLVLGFSHVERGPGLARALGLGLVPVVGRARTTRHPRPATRLAYGHRSPPDRGNGAPPRRRPRRTDTRPRNAPPRPRHRVGHVVCADQRLGPHLRMDGNVGAPRPTLPCAVRRRRPSAGANPARQLSLQPVAVGAGEGGNDLV